MVTYGSLKVCYYGGPIPSEFSNVDNYYLFTYPCEDKKDYTCYPFKIQINPGMWVFEAWGASGSQHHKFNQSMPGQGGYAKGTLTINEILTLYLYIGGTASRFNGGGNGVPGGSASDIRLDISSDSSNWNDTTSLRSRILVAGAGGGQERVCGGNAGESSTDNFTWLHQDNYSEQWIIENGGAGTQEEGGKEGSCYYNSTSIRIGKPGGFGYGGDGIGGDDDGPGGGSGYFGGGGIALAGAGGGGSSFVSGHPGCRAINGSNTDEIVTTDNPIHYSEIYFNYTQIINGNQTMP